MRISLEKQELARRYIGRAIMARAKLPRVRFADFM